jgi:hypothetical protein
MSTTIHVPARLEHDAERVAKRERERRERGRRVKNKRRALSAKSAAPG